jgi:hypothetical protein
MFLTQGINMDIFAAFATDPKLEEEGRWVRIGGTDEKPAEILVARTGTKRYSRVMTQQYEANKTLLESKDTQAANDKVDEMVAHALASCVLLGWKNIEYKGDAIYSYTNARAMLSHRDFREMVTKEADKFQAYKVEQDAVDAKNSKPA